MSTVMGWPTLPDDIRHLIFKKLKEDEPSIFNSIAVCREWREKLELVAFREIHIRLPLVNNRLKLAHSRRDVLDRLVLHIDLPKTKCVHCGEDPMDPEDLQDVMTCSIRRFFRILSSWKRSSRALTLEVRVSGSCGNKDCDGVSSATLEPGLLQHGRIPTFWRSIPEVLAITCLEIRSQNCRYIDMSSVQRLACCFTELQNLCYEPRSMHIYWTPSLTTYDHMEVLSKLCRLADRASKHIQIFEVSDRPTSDHMDSDPHIAIYQRFFLDTFLKLESISIAFVIDMTYFFGTDHGLVSETLKYITLTSQSLATGEDSCMKINKLLTNMAQFATYLPNLRTMTLWNHNAIDACAFIYETSQSETKITWRGTWIPDFDTATIESWKAVALRHAEAELSIFREDLDASHALKSRGHAIQHLRLPVEVLHPRSLEQLLEEADDGSTEVISAPAAAIED